MKLSSSQKKIATYIFLTFLAVGVYLNSLGNEFVADDIPAILQNPNIGNLFFNIKDQPLNFLRHIFYFLAYNLGGLNPLFYRLVNILFHLGSVWVIFAILSFLHTEGVALIAAALFAVHPVLSEAVTWISGGAHSQYAFFVLLTLLFYLWSRSRNWSKKFYLSSLGSFMLALLTTEKAATLPLIIAVFEISVDCGRKNLKRSVPFFLLSGFWALWIFSGGALSQRIADLQSHYYQQPGTQNPLAVVTVALTSYLGLIFWPKNLTLYHSEMSFSSVEFYLRLLELLVFLGLTVYAFWKSRPLFFWASFFVISLLPMMTPFGISWIVAERYVYLSSLGIFVIVAVGIQEIVEKLNHSSLQLGRSSKLYVILVPLLLILTARTVARNNDWKNQDTLWLAAAKTSPSSPQNHNNLGDLYGRRGDLERSAAEFQKAIELNPGYADAYHNLGNTYLQMGKVEEAIESFKKAAELNPGLWQSCQNLAAIYFERGEFELAKEWMEKAVAANPEDPNLRRNLEIINAQISTP